MVDVQRYPEFSWGLSRHKTLSECARRYALSYYFSYGGWGKGASNLRRHVYRLKTLQSIHMLFGTSVHNQIHRLLSEPDYFLEMPSEAEIISNVRVDLNKAYQDSKYHSALWYDKPSDFSMLSEIYYDNEISVEVLKEYQLKIPSTVKNLLSSRTIQDMYQRRDKYELIVSERFQYVEVNGVKVWIVMDLAFRDLEMDKVIVVDFKTGKRSSNDLEQLNLYAKFIAEAYRIEDLDQIELRNEYLLDGTNNAYTPKIFDLEKIDYLIHTSIDHMQSYLQDVEHNMPIPLEQFPQSLRACKQCCYREICGMV
jgi:CRISPR/Cas system-associated exonuclease Cas4 (RecB family)